MNVTSSPFSTALNQYPISEDEKQGVHRLHDACCEFAAEGIETPWKGMRQYDYMLGAIPRLFRDTLERACDPSINSSIFDGRSYWQDQRREIHRRAFLQYRMNIHPEDIRRLVEASGEATPLIKAGVRVKLIIPGTSAEIPIMKVAAEKARTVLALCSREDLLENDLPFSFRPLVYTLEEIECNAPSLIPGTTYAYKMPEVLEQAKKSRLDLKLEIARFTCILDEVKKEGWFVPSRVSGIISPESGILDKNWSDYYQVENFRAVILRLLFMCPFSSKEERNSVRKTVREGIRELEYLLRPEDRNKYRSELNRLSRLTDENAPTFSPEDQELARESFPIIWGSLSLEESDYVQYEDGCKRKVREIRIDKLELGKHIQLAFTEKDCVEKLQRAVGEHVRVLSLDALAFMNGHNVSLERDYFRRRDEEERHGLQQVNGSPLNEEAHPLRSTWRSYVPRISEDLAQIIRPLEA